VSTDSPSHSSLLVSFFPSSPHPPSSTLFPYTTLFRSKNSTTKRAEQTSAVNAPTSKPGRYRARVHQNSGNITAITSAPSSSASRSEEHTSELQSRENLVCRLLLEKKKQERTTQTSQ